MVKVLPYDSKVIRNQIINAVDRAALGGYLDLSLHEALETLWKPLQREANEIIKALDEGISASDVNEFKTADCQVLM